MSENPDDELDELRQKRLEQLQDQAEEQQASEEMQDQAQQQRDAQKQAILRKFLTDEARQRLNTVKMSKPQFAEKVEQQIIALAQSGRINNRLEDEQMKQLLDELKPEKKRFDIRRR